MFGDRRIWAMTLAALAATAIGAALLGFLGPWGADRASTLLFAATLLALALLLVALLGLAPAHQGASALGRLRTSLLIAAALGGGLGANLALYRHDVHFDVTRERSFTPPPQARELVSGLAEDLTLTYFYNKGDAEALRAKELLEVLDRGSRHFTLRAVDIDREPALARTYEVRAYNTAVVEVDGRRVMLARTTDLAQMAYLALRALRRRVETVCFVAGHGELAPGTAAGHVHYTHRETLRAHHGYGTEDEVVGAADGLDKLVAALDEVGFAVREIVLEGLEQAPGDCTAIIDAGPRRVMAPHEATLLAGYLAAGGGLMLLVDPESPVASGLGALLGSLGLEAAPGTLVDPTNHFGSDLEAIAVPSYTRHAVTEDLGLTYFAGARALALTVPPESVTAFPLFGSSRDSYLRQPGNAASAPPEDAPRAQRILALAAEGRLPHGPESAPPFRLVVVGDSDFITNAHVGTVSNADLALSAVRWLARDESLPRVAARRPSTDRVTLTRAAMQAIFLSVGVALPLGMALLGAFVWWRRR